jgi:hypothetical protein
MHTAEWGWGTSLANGETLDVVEPDHLVGVQGGVRVDPPLGDGSVVERVGHRGVTHADRVDDVLDPQALGA